MVTSLYVPYSIAYSLFKRTKHNKTQNMDSTSQNQQSKQITIPYVQGVAEKIGRLLRREGVQTAFKPVHTLNQVFPRPKDRQTFLYNFKYFFMIRKLEINAYH